MDSYVEELRAADLFCNQFFLPTITTEVPPTRPVKILREVPPTRLVTPSLGNAQVPLKIRKARIPLRRDDDDLPDLVLPESDREDFIEHSNIFLEYEAEFDVEKYCEWIRSLSSRRGVVLKSVSAVAARGKTCALVKWHRVLRSKCRQILDYKGQHPVLRRAYKIEHRIRTQWYMERMRASGVSK